MFLSSACQSELKQTLSISVPLNSDCANLISSVFIETSKLKVENLFNMKIVCEVVLVLTLFLHVHAASDENSLTQDDDARLIFNNITEHIGSMASKKPFSWPIVKSMDHECMLNKYKEHNFMSKMLTEDVLDCDDVDSKLVLLTIGTSCSSKFHALLGFIFDSAFALADLINAFRDDEPFKGYLDNLICFNNYAVRSKWIDTNVYNDFEYNLINKTEEECDQKIQKFREPANAILKEIIAFQPGVPVCFKNEIFSTAEKIFFKYAILIPANISVEQKKNAKMNFVNDIEDALNQLLNCSKKAVHLFKNCRKFKPRPFRRLKSNDNSNLRRFSKN